MTDHLFFDSAADAARAAGLSSSTIIDRIKAGEIPGSYLSSDGWWRVPVEGMRAAGYSVTGEGAHAVGPHDQALPTPDSVEDGVAEWLGGMVEADDKHVKLYELPRLSAPSAVEKIAHAILAAVAHARTQGATDE